MENMTEHTGEKNAIPNFLPRRPLVGHFLKKREIREIMMLIMIMVVIGMYIFRFGRSITISPGSRPMGNFPSHGQRSPAARNITPSMINVFCILIFFLADKPAA
jgi:hypothetical protein